MLALMATLAQRGGEVQIDTRFTIDGLVALIAGILILIVPRLLNYIVAAYLIYIGLVNLFDVKF